MLLPPLPLSQTVTPSWTPFPLERDVLYGRPLKPANLLSIDAGLVLLLLWIPFYRVLPVPGLPQCGFLVLSCLPTLRAITWMRFSSASSIHALRMLRSHGPGSPQLHVISRFDMSQRVENRWPIGMWEIEV